jgi:hypothetical protein
MATDDLAKVADNFSKFSFLKAALRDLNLQQDVTIFISLSSASDYTDTSR